MISEMQAKKLGKSLIKRMKGKEWKLHIWENLGWHYEASLGGLTISPSQEKTKTKYYALLSNQSWRGTGEMYWMDNFHSTDPNKAVIHQIKLAEQFVNKCNETLRFIKKNIISSHKK